MAAKLREVIGRLARAQLEATRQLRPERRLERQVLARDRHAGIRKDGARLRDAIIQRPATAPPEDDLPGLRRGLRAPVARNDGPPSRIHCW